MDYAKQYQNARRINPEHVLRLPNPEAVFDIKSHAAQNNSSEVKQHEKEIYEEKGFANQASWRGFTPDMIKPGQTQADAVKLELANGWPDGCKLINQARAQVLNVALQAPDSRRLRMEHGFVNGFNPHVTGMLNGDPNPYSRWGRKPKVQAVRLLCELVASGGYDAHDLVWRGAATLVIADLLQEAGYAVEIWAVNTVSLSGTSTCTAALVKPADLQPIPDMLASVLVSPRYYRTAMLPSPKAFNVEVPFGYGRCENLTPSSLEGTDLEDLAHGIYVGQCFNVGAAVAKVNEITSEINGSK